MDSSNWWMRGEGRRCGLLSEVVERSSPGGLWTLKNSDGLLCSRRCENEIREDDWGTVKSGQKCQASDDAIRTLKGLIPEERCILHCLLGGTNGLRGH